jgi:hypothetical protein
VKLPNNQDQKLKYFYGCKQHPAWRDPCQLVQEPGETITILLASANVSPLEGPVVAPPSLTDPAQASPQPTEVLAGSIERVTFHNAENGFCVLRIKARGHRDLQQLLNPDPTEQMERFGWRFAQAEQSHLRFGRAIYYGRLERSAIERICSLAGADAGMSLNCRAPLEFDFFVVPLCKKTLISILLTFEPNWPF